MDDGCRSMQDYYAMLTGNCYRLQQRNEKLRAALDMMIQIHGAVDFDTSEDNDLRDKAVATARLALS